MNTSRALTVSETGERLGLSKPTVLKYLKTGDIPGRKIGHSWRISPQAIESLLWCSGGNDGEPSEPNVPKAA